MHFTTALLALLAGSAIAAPATSINPRQKACFIIGNTALPKEVSDAANSLASSVTCSSTAKTLSGVPDLTSGTTSFSQIDFATVGKGQATLAFALKQFATANPLASTDLKKFQDSLAVYTATEAGIRSVGGNVNGIKAPKFFLSMQVSRILTAQGKAPTAAGLQVDHLRDKVTKNAAGQDKALLAQVVALAKQVQ